MLAKMSPSKPEACQPFAGRLSAAPLTTPQQKSTPDRGARLLGYLSDAKNSNRGLRRLTLIEKSYPRPPRNPRLNLPGLN